MQAIVQRTLLLLVLLHVGTSSPSQTTPPLIHSALTVPRGRTAYLERTDDVINMTTNSEGGGVTCKVKVVTDDPATLRVGYVEPAVFDCAFKPRTVRYRHNGSPLLIRDVIRLIVFTFNGSDVTSQSLQLTVAVAEPAYEIFVEQRRQKSAAVTVPANGQSASINKTVLRFTYDFNGGVNCLVSPYADGRFPSSGTLARANALNAAAAPMNASMDCREFLDAGYRYNRNDSSDATQSVDYIPLYVETESRVSSEANGVLNERDVLGESLYLEVNVLGAQENSPPTIRVSDAQPIRVAQYSVKMINSDVLFAADDFTNGKYLVINVTSTLSAKDTGFFVDAKDRGKFLTSFTQDDILNNRIVYHTPTTILSQELEISIELVAIDTFFARSETAILRFLITPVKTSSPKVLQNTGLVVLEGGSATITLANLNVVDADNLDQVEVHVKGGLKHGVLEVDGNKATVFTVKDLESGHVVYRHDHGDSTEDKLFLRITDGKHSTRDKLIITVIPLDDSSPYIVTNLPVSVTSGGFIQITRANLNANDKDANLRGRGGTTYVLKSRPARGEIVKRRTALTQGRKVSTFTQTDINNGLVYYQHHGGGETGDASSSSSSSSATARLDSFEFRLLDDNDPPNKSGMYTFEIQIEPSSGVMSPHPVEDVIMHITLNETESFVLTKDVLAFEDVEGVSDAGESLKYTITSQPYFLTSTVTLDAGRLIRIDSDVTIIAKCHPYPTLTEFTQKEVDEELIAYQPPCESIGPISRHIQFQFSVCNRQTICVMDQTFDVTVLPLNVDPRGAASFSVKPLKVTAGGTVRLSPDDLLSFDPSGVQNNELLLLAIEREPMNGRLVMNNVRLMNGEPFSVDDLRDSDIRYIDNGSSQSDDSFEISISDGDNKIYKKIPVVVDSRVNKRPQPRANLNSRVNVTEFGEVYLTTENLAATDNDTDDRLLNFILVKLPELGEVRVGARKVDQFSQGELLDGRVRYVHSGKEIGRLPVKDVVTFTVLDQSPPAAAETIPLIDLEVTIEPVDNSPPELLVGGPLLVQEGKAACITADIVSARDLDSPDEALMFVVAQTPMWGFLERSKGTSRSGRSQTSRRISSFTLADLREGTVLYVPSNLSKGSPPSDSFFIYCTDGLNQSPLSQIEISVLPPNIKLPDFELSNLVLQEGGEMKIHIQMTGGLIDSRSKTADVSTLSVATPPLHGELILAKSEPQKGTKEVRFHEIVLDELNGPGVELIYRHDGSESNDDRFALSLSEGIHVVKRTCMVTILPVNDARPELHRAGPLYVDYGGTRLITNSVLKAVDDDSNNSEIYFVIVATPRKGILERQHAVDNKGSGVVYGNEWKVLETGDNFTQAAVDENLVRFTHTTELGESSGDKFLFSVTDGAHTLSGLTFLIEISRMSPRRFLLHNLGLSVKDGERKFIGADELKADDGGRQPLDVIFTVSEYPKHGTLGLISQTNASAEVRQFTQLDINEKKVYYQHENMTAAGGGLSSSSSSSSLEDKMTLVITSGRLTVAPMTTVFKFTVVTDNEYLPSLVTNIPLTIIQGTTTNIPSANLLVAHSPRDGSASSFSSSSSSSSPGTLAYIVVERPKHGQLLIRGFPVTGSFTQLDLDVGDIDYASDNSDAASMTDYFLFTVTDTSRTRHDVGYLINGTVHRRPAFFNILIQPVTKEAPKLMHNRSPEQLVSLGNEKIGFWITGEQLKATHPFFSGEDITFTIKDAPRFGTLEYGATGRPAKKRVTQKELDEGRIAYVLNERPLRATSDNFTFRVQDGNRNTLDDQKFELDWAMVEFGQAQYVVCEDIGTLTVKVLRRGSTAGLVKVQVRAKELSARERLDFVQPVNSTLVFEPGMTELTFTVDIVNDRIEDEDDEKFKLLLRHPVNAVLGDVSRAVVDIINVERGRCDDAGRALRGSPLPGAGLSTNIERRTGNRNIFATRQSYDRSGGFNSFDDYGPDGGETDDLDDPDDPQYPDYIETDWSELPGSSADLTFYRPGDSIDRSPGGGMETPADEIDWEGHNWEEDEGGAVRGDTVVGGEKKKNKKREKMEHPLKKYNKERKQLKGAGGVYNPPRGVFDSTWDTVELRLDDFDSVTRAPPPTTVTVSTTTQRSNTFSPQECTHDTNGLLYFDLLSSKMFRCSGHNWEPWGWGAGEAYQYTALLKDSSASSSSGVRDSPNKDKADSHEEAEEDDRWRHAEERLSPMSRKNKERKKSHCPPNWSIFDSNCYKLGEGKTTWNMAQDKCRTVYDGHLTDVLSRKHLLWLWSLASESHFWIGLNDKKSAGTWKYVSGIDPPTSFFNWRRNFPRVNGRQRHCVMTSKRMEWVNRPCDAQKAKYICVQPASTRARRQPMMHRSGGGGTRDSRGEGGVRG